MRNTLGTLIKGQIHVLPNGRYAFFGGQDRLKLKDEKVLSTSNVLCCLISCLKY